MHRYLTWHIWLSFLLGIVSTVVVSWALALRGLDDTESVDDVCAVWYRDRCGNHVSRDRSFGCDIYLLRCFHVPAGMFESALGPTDPTTAEDVLPRWTAGYKLLEASALSREIASPAGGSVIDLAYGWPCLALRSRAGIQFDFENVTRINNINIKDGMRRGGPAGPQGIPTILPVHSILPGCILNILIYMMVWFVLLAFLQAGVRCFRQSRGWCPQCDYDLTGIGDTGCPECGRNRTAGRQS